MVTGGNSRNGSHVDSSCLCRRRLSGCRGSLVCGRYASRSALVPVMLKSDLVPGRKKEDFSGLTQAAFRQRLDPAGGLNPGRATLELARCPEPFRRPCTGRVVDRTISAIFAHVNTSDIFGGKKKPAASGTVVLDGIVRSPFCGDQRSFCDPFPTRLELLGYVAKCANARARSPCTVFFWCLPRRRGAQPARG